MDLKIYPLDFVLVLNATSEYLTSVFKDNYDAEVISAYYCLVGQSKFKDNDREVIVMYTSYSSLSIPVIMHEIVHVANRVFKYIGQDLDIENDETYAYLCDYVAEFIVKSIGFNKLIKTK